MWEFSGTINFSRLTRKVLGSFKTVLCMHEIK